MTTDERRLTHEAVATPLSVATFPDAVVLRSEDSMTIQYDDLGRIAAVEAVQQWECDGCGARVVDCVMNRCAYCGRSRGVGG